jgi:hypothetical protein
MIPPLAGDPAGCPYNLGIGGAWAAEAALMCSDFRHGSSTKFIGTQSARRLRPPNGIYETGSGMLQLCLGNQGDSQLDCGVWATRPIGLSPAGYWDESTPAAGCLSQIMDKANISKDR